MTLEERLYKGDQAKLVLENEVFQAVFADIEKDLIESWKNIPSSPKHADDREKTHLAVTMLGKVKASLEQTLESGKLAKVELEYLHQQSLLDRARNYLSPN